MPTLHWLTREEDVGAAGRVPYRLQLLRDLLAEDGSIWVSIDDHEAHYLKVVMDEVFGRDNFIVRAAAGGFAGPLTIYAARTMLGSAALKAERLAFKQTPYDVAARA